jgi:two-component system phosphate regulon sensor histidine kinase PhoR
VSGAHRIPRAASDTVRIDRSMAAETRSRAKALTIAAAPAVIVVTALAIADALPVAGAAAVLAVLAAGLMWYEGRRPAAVVAPDAKPASVETRPTSAILDLLPDPVILVNAQREITVANRAAREALGVSESGRDLALTLRHPAVLAAVDSVQAGETHVSREITLPVPTPRSFTLHAGRLAEAVDAEGTRVVLTFHDETRAMRAERSRADFVANASHELRSPLSALIGFIETLRGPASDDADARERFLGVMHGEALRMARLVEHLMSLSRVELNEHVPPRSRADPRVVLTTVAEALAARADAKRMRIELALADALPMVLGDSDQLMQVFHNLIDNAVRYGRAGTAIRVEARTNDRGSGSARILSIVVGDEGDGIPAIHLPRLTERFYRVDEGRSRRLGGTGLGLAIVKHIVNRHRGRLTIESRVGQGSTFTVVLPTADGDGAGSKTSTH